MNRRSNIELLRIILISLVVIQHLIGIAVFPSELRCDAINGETILISSIFSISYLAVNCFVFISGFYGIKFRLSGLLNLTFAVFFYSTIDYICSSLFQFTDFSIKEFISRSVLCLSHSDIWFIHCYLYLYILSPFLNFGISHFSAKNLSTFVILLSILNLYFGYFWHMESFNYTGYNISQFIYLYIVAGFFKKYFEEKERKKERKKELQIDGKNKYIHLLIFLLSTGTYTFLFLFSKGHHIPHYNLYEYNNPFVIISAISLFLLFRSFNIKQSIVINSLSSGCLGVYLLQSQPFFSKNILFKFANLFSNQFVFETRLGYIVPVFALILYAFVSVLIMLMFDRIRQRIFRHIISLVSNIDTL